VNYGARARLQYQSIDEDRHFDIINLQNYDLVLGTPFMFQHKILMGLNPSRMVVGSAKALPMKGEEVMTLESRVSEIHHESLEKVREDLKKLVRPLCAKASETGLPPLRAINHSIPLIDEKKIYSGSKKCPNVCGFSCNCFMVSQGVGI